MEKRKHHFRDGMSSCNEEIFEKRYNQICSICKKFHFNLEMHHIDGNKNNNHSDNLIFICKDCHYKVHGNLRWKQGEKYDKEKWNNIYRLRERFK